MDSMETSAKAAAPPAARYAFDDFQLDPGRLLLVRDRQPVPLPPKAVALLSLFAANPGRLLTKDELLSGVWPDSVVEESNLTQYVFLLRKALGQTKGDRRYIVTVPGRGYRFTASIRAVFEPPAPDSAAGPPVKSVAVLPFHVLSCQDSDDYVGLGFADALITRLGYVAGVRVRPTGAVMRYAGRQADPLAAAGELGVEYVVTGTIQRFADQVRVTVQLFLANDGAIAWARQFDESFTTLFALEDSLSEQVLRFLEPNLTRDLRKQFPRVASAANEAYHSYLKGRFFWNTRTGEGLQKAIGWFEDAIARDPSFASAYTGLADCYNLLGYYAERPPAETYPAARAAALKAIEIDDRLSEAHASLALVAAEYEWDWNRAGLEYRLALQLNPNNAAAHSWYADLLMAAGRPEESFREIQQARDLDPLSLIFNCDLGFLLYMARRYREAAAHLRDTAEMDPSHWRIHRFLAWALALSGDGGEALAALETALELSPGNPGLQADKGYVLALCGRQGEARAVLNRLIALSAARYVSPYDIAKLQTVLGDLDAAFDWLARALQVRPWQMMFLNVDPQFEPLRSIARFSSAANQAGFPRTHLEV